MDDTYTIIIAGSAAVGSLASAILGWLKQNPPEEFNWGKFGASILTAVISGIGIAQLFDYVNVSSPLMGMISAFLSGVGVDSGVSRAVGIYKVFKDK